MSEALPITSDSSEPRPGSSRHIGFLVLLMLFAAFVADVAFFSRQLPNRVATHFDLHGKANGWMSREQYRNFTLGVGLGTSVFVVGVLALVQKIGGRGLNLPNKEFWLAEERREATYQFLQSHFLWLGGLIVVFHAGLFHAVVAANSHTPALLSPAWTIALLAGDLVLIGTWLVVLLKRFRLPAA